MSAETGTRLTGNVLRNFHQQLAHCIANMDSLSDELIASDLHSLGLRYVSVTEARLQWLNLMSRLHVDLSRYLIQPPVLSVRVGLNPSSHGRAGWAEIITDLSQVVHNCIRQESADHSPEAVETPSAASVGRNPVEVQPPSPLEAEAEQQQPNPLPPPNLLLQLIQSPFMQRGFQTAAAHPELLQRVIHVLQTRAGEPSPNIASVSSPRDPQDLNPQT